ncbi:hypothetical protein SCATT_p04990 (plasmid) [Streptantibioticus cattleyicolor NRRL 8057 = DSM 46488]|uniref:Uncharacterized protein n=1 Tax=Streptantibioticus cattleyicolor (strain ATCC 35852 / DSM 46488 / JCM 4925 / NBRC 14057 / NRRL 8057) TaxID=1003195 RepID=G8XGD4_STREN|nr:hypothetical protein SCATT_p04990 [Streptantibioticus cattleyicolor NRRL 8057 = DSM 46488]
MSVPLATCELQTAVPDVPPLTCRDLYASVYVELVSRYTPPYRRGGRRHDRRFRCFPLPGT